MTYICKTCGNNFESFDLMAKVPCPACKSRNTVRYEMPFKKVEKEEEPMLDGIDRELCYKLKRVVMDALAAEGTFELKEIQLDDPGFTMVAVADGSFPKSKLPVTIQIRYGNELLSARRKNHQI